MIVPLGDLETRELVTVKGTSEGRRAKRFVAAFVLTFAFDEADDTAAIGTVGWSMPQKRDAAPEGAAASVWFPADRT
jgi:hypothetical protein